jgi:hypothetical protein
MSTPIKISELLNLNQITEDDYIIINDSGSTTTYRASISTFGDFLSGSTKPVGSASFAKTAHDDVPTTFTVFAGKSSNGWIYVEYTDLYECEELNAVSADIQNVENVESSESNA